MAGAAGVRRLQGMDDNTEPALAFAAPVTSARLPAATDTSTSTTTGTGTGTGTPISRPAQPKPRYSAAWWALIFAAIHVYWAVGAVFGFGSDGDAANSAAGRGGFIAYDMFIVVLLLIGTAIGAVLLRPDWQRRFPRWMLRTGAWIATVLLLLRGGLGLIEDLLRVVGVLPHGFFGMTNQQIYGTPHPSAYTLWSLTVIEAYFLLGGILFAVTFRRYHRDHSDQRSQRTSE